MIRNTIENLYVPYDKTEYILFAKDRFFLVAPPYSELQRRLSLAEEKLQLLLSRMDEHTNS